MGLMVIFVDVQDTTILLSQYNTQQLNLVERRPSMGNYIGKSIKRVEDVRFITGKGKYTDDIVLPNMTYGHIVRSPYAHAKIVSVNITEANGTSWFNGIRR